ncbi:MAG: hypothetical protein R3233_08250, partial [Xanthomonadales bacterium]|nr:hypothetical protein [Xanthomonadales bacterium]
MNSVLHGLSADPGSKKSQPLFKPACFWAAPRHIAISFDLVWGKNGLILPAKEGHAMKARLPLVLSVTILAGLALPVWANNFEQVWSCGIRPGKALDDVRKVSSAWLRAARSMDGGERLQLHIRYPIVVQPSAER